MQFVQRNEFFGSVVYDKKGKDYFHLDPLATRILKEPGWIPTDSELVVYQAERDEVAAVTLDLQQRGMTGQTELKNNAAVPGMLSAPLRIFYEITYRCPEHCEHCYTDAGPKNSKELSLQEKLAIVPQMAEMGCYRISIAGGEPLVDKDFFPFIEYALEAQIDVSFSTSGTPITEPTARRLGELDIRTINVSLDGWDEESFGSVRGRDRLQFVMRGVRCLRKHYRNKIAAKCTLMTTNLQHLDLIIEFAKELEFDVVKFNCVREAGRAIDAKRLLPTREEYIAAIQRLADIYNSGSAGIKMVLPVNPFQQLGDSVDVIEELGFGCYAGKESFCINPLGDIQPCSSFGPDTYVDGNVRGLDLRRAWLEGHAMRLFRGLDGSDECHGCRSYDGCRGGCYLRAFRAFDDIRALDPYCYEHDAKGLNGRQFDVPLAMLASS